MDMLITKLFDSWITQLTIQDNKTSITLDQNNTAALEINHGLIVNFQAQSSPPVLTLYVLVGVLPPENRAFLMENMLEANLLWAATAGATLSLHRSSYNNEPQLVVAQAIPVHKGTAIRQLSDVFNNICLVALDWRARIENGAQWTVPADREMLDSVNPDLLS